MPFQRRRKCIFHWCGRTWLTIWDRVKIPQYSHRLMHQKRVTCELHNSYFRLMTIKHAIPKTGEVTHSDGQFLGDIEWAIELLYNSVKTGSHLVWKRDAVEKASTQQKGPWEPTVNEFGDRRVWTQDVVEKSSTQQRAGSPGHRLSNPGEPERNADGHKSGDVNMLQFCSVSNTLSDTTLSNKVRGIFL